ncbi:MAG: hypothetical protein GY714_25245 [Desulfobacterales bacterium]|nr:hypothetical protein [Desulfobacterales bacterium]
MKERISTFLFGVVFFILATTVSVANDVELSPAQLVAEKFKSVLSGNDASDVKAMMAKKYKVLRLMNGDGTWKDPALTDISGYLLPYDIDNAKLEAFIDKIAETAEENPYLMNFLNQTKGKTFENLFNKVEKEGDRVLPDVISYALVLDRLTFAMSDDWKILETCKNIWISEKEKVDLKKYLNLFEIAKITTIEYRIGSYIDYHKTREIPSYSSKVMLPVNIMEAVITDKVNGFNNNAIAGLVLTKNPSGNLINDPKTGSGPTTWSEDGKTIEYRPPLPLQWSNLYATWNMAFVSQYENFPYFFCKLLVPQVNAFQEHPEGYLYNRVLSLNTHIYFTLFERIDNEIAGIEGIKWNDDDLTAQWGEVNKKSSFDYQISVWEAK